MPNKGFPTRTGTIELSFLSSYEFESSWKNLTSKGTLRLPKNLYYKDEGNSNNPLNGTKVNIGGYTDGIPPLFMRGDKIELKAGYQYWSGDRFVTDWGEILSTGWITKVKSTLPIELDIEDNMFILKRTRLPNRTFAKTDTLENIMLFIIAHCNKINGTSLTINPLGTTTFGQLRCENESGAQLLNRIHSAYGINSYFRGNELRSGVLINVEKEANNYIFYMNGDKGNVVGEGQELEYQRKEDLVLSAIAHNTIDTTDGTCKDGVTPKTKKQRIEVLVTITGEDTYDYDVIEKGERVPENIEGERRTFFFQDATTVKDLAKKAYDKLKEVYYTGLKGTFVIFGIPFIKHGDYVTLINPKQPEQDGKYKVKSVVYSGGGQGIRQTIELYYRIP